MTAVDFRMGEVETEDERIEVWVATLGEVRGVGTTKASALRDLGNRIQFRELLMAVGEWEQ